MQEMQKITLKLHFSDLIFSNFTSTNLNRLAPIPAFTINSIVLYLVAMVV